MSMTLRKMAIKYCDICTVPAQQHLVALDTIIVLTYLLTVKLIHVYYTRGLNIATLQVKISQN